MSFAASDMIANITSSPDFGGTGFSLWGLDLA